MAFSAVSTQWRIDKGIRTGLAYEACMPLLELKLARWKADLPAAMAEELGLEGVELVDLMDDVQAIEQALLQVQQEGRDRARLEAGPHDDGEGLL